MKKEIKITGIESTPLKIILLQDKLKYNFWIKKQDGTETKAYQQFQKFRFTAGDVVVAEVVEQEKSFVNEKGKDIAFTDRTIKFFYTMDEDTPQSHQTPKIEAQGVQTLEADIDVLEEKINALTQKLNNVQFAVHALWAVLIQGDKDKENKYELHKIPLIAKSKPEEPNQNIPTWEKPQY